MAAPSAADAGAAARDGAAAGDSVTAGASLGDGFGNDEQPLVRGAAAAASRDAKPSWHRGPAASNGNGDMHSRMRATVAAGGGDLAHAGSGGPPLGADGANGSGGGGSAHAAAAAAAAAWEGGGAAPAAEAARTLPLKKRAGSPRGGARARRRVDALGAGGGGARVGGSGSAAGGGPGHANGGSGVCAVAGSGGGAPIVSFPACSTGACAQCGSAAPDVPFCSDECPRRYVGARREQAVRADLRGVVGPPLKARGPLGPFISDAEAGAARDATVSGVRGGASQRDGRAGLSSADIGRATARAAACGGGSAPAPAAEACATAAAVPAAGGGELAFQFDIVDVAAAIAGVPRASLVRPHAEAAGGSAVPPDAFVAFGNQRASAPYAFTLDETTRLMEAMGKFQSASVGGLIAPRAGVS